MRSFLIIVAALALSISASAQDLLVKRNGEQMKVKVLKITKNKVQFTRYGSELPVYTLPISEIEYIEYPMGDRDTFNQSADSSKTTTAPTASAVDNTEPKRWHGAVSSQGIVPDTTPTTKRYSIGEIYDKDGIKGIVAVLYDGGEHGLVMSLDEACLPWCILHRKQIKKIGANDRYDGMANMKAVEKYIIDNNLSWHQFPAFKWCRDKGEGWFLPSINELWSAGTMSMGGSRAAINRKFRKSYNNAIENADGTPLSNIMIYHSSTEDEDARYSLYAHMNSESPNTGSGYKADDLFVRAFYKF